MDELFRMRTAGWLTVPLGLVTVLGCLSLPLLLSPPVVEGPSWSLRRRSRASARTCTQGRIVVLRTVAPSSTGIRDLPPSDA